MRKLLSIVFACMLLLGATHALAYDMETYVIDNTNEGGPLSTAISTSTIVPGKCWILGYEVGPYSGLSKENYIVLYDAASVSAASSSNIFGESEAATGESLVRWYPSAKKLRNGLVVDQGSSTVVTIFYEQRIKGIE